MSLAVVRCPACGGASRVSADALGHMVGCPRCHTPFVAAEDAPARPFPTSKPPAPVPKRPVRARSVRSDESPRASAVIPIAPPRQPPTGAPDVQKAQDHEHDPVTPPATGGLPLSVMVGFALMPFGIPLLWLLGPLVTGFDAALSPAVPAALAVAASALCLGIVHTIDWTGSTRLKGVFMLVGLAYLSAAGLYFLKPALVARVQKFFALPTVWFPVPAEPNGEYYVKMPGAPVEARPVAVGGVEWQPGWGVTREAHTQDGPKTYRYLFAVSQPRLAQAADPDDAWFAAVGRHLSDSTKGQLVHGEKVNSPDNHPGHEWQLKLSDGETVLIVRVFVVQGRVYYLSAQGPGLTPEDPELSKPFFDSFARSPDDVGRPGRGAQKKAKR